MEHTAGALAGPVRKSARNEGMKEPNYDEDQYYYEDQCSDDASSDGSSSAGGSAPTEEGYASTRLYAEMHYRSSHNERQQI